MVRSESKGDLLSGCMNFGWKSSRLPVCVCVQGFSGSVAGDGVETWNEQGSGSEETCSNSSSAITFLCDLAGLASYRSSLEFQFRDSKMRGWNLNIPKASLNTTSLEIPKPSSSMNENSSSIHCYQHSNCFFFPADFATYVIWALLRGILFRCLGPSPLMLARSSKRTKCTSQVGSGLWIKISNQSTNIYFT